MFLMVWGHAIQCGNGQLFITNQTYFSDLIFRAIYSFHMPLFSILAGYLLYSSLMFKSSQEVMKKRVVSLGLPIVTWGTVDFIIELINSEACQGIIGTIKLLIYSFLGSLWFLWAMLLCTAVVIVVHHCFKDSIIGYCIVFILCFFFTDKYNLGYFKFLYPFFVGGYYWRILYKLVPFCKKKVGIKTKITLLVVIIHVWGRMVVNFGQDNFIYTTGFCIIGKAMPLQQLYINIYRILIGYLGSGMVLLLFQILFQYIEISDKFLLTILGRNSLGVYIFDVYISNYFLTIVCENLQSNNIRTFVISIILSCLCVIITACVSRCRLLSSLMLGGR